MWGLGRQKPRYAGGPHYSGGMNRPGSVTHVWKLIRKLPRHCSLNLRMLTHKSMVFTLCKRSEWGCGGCLTAPLHFLNLLFAFSISIVALPSLKLHLITSFSSTMSVLKKEHYPLNPSYPQYFIALRVR